MRRLRHATIVATLGPASSDLGTIRALFDSGADVLRLNFSHGTHAQHQERLDLIRCVERETGRPIGVLLAASGDLRRAETGHRSPDRVRPHTHLRTLPL